MEKKRKIEMVVKKVSFAEAEEEELMYWAKLSVRERLTAAAKWNKEVWKYLLNEDYPEKIELTGGKQSKALTDEDDF